MDSLGFHIDWRAFWLAMAWALLLAIVYIRRRGEAVPYLVFSDTTSFQRGRQGWRVKLASLPRRLYLMAMGLFLIAFLDPHSINPKEMDSGQSSRQSQQKPDNQVVTPTEGIAIYLAVDHSSSMGEEVIVSSGDGKKDKLSKMELLKRFTSEFVKGDQQAGLQGRHSDLIGLVSFARTPKVLSPLTLDHDYLLQKLDQVQIVDSDDEDGTAVGYAIYKVVNIIVATKHFSKDLIKIGRPSYEITSTVIILITDGVHNPHPDDRSNPLRGMDLETAAQFSKQHGVRIYIVNIEPAILQPQFKYKKEQLQRVAESTGGRLLVTEQSGSLLDIYSEIDRLEKSNLPNDLKVKQQPKIEMGNEFVRVSYYPCLIALGMFCIALSVLLDGSVLRRIP